MRNEKAAHDFHGRPDAGARGASPADSLASGDASPQAPLAAGALVALIPAYNEVATIRDLVLRTIEVIPDVIVVDDGSVDGTAAALAGLPVTVLRNPRNAGKAASLWRGFAHALERGARAVVTLDGDGQHRPEDTGRLLAAAERFPGRIVIGARLHDRANFPPRRYYANQFARFWISWAAGYPIADTQSGFRIYPAALFRKLTVRDVSWGGFVFESEVLIRAAGVGITSVAVAIPGIYPKQARASHFRPVRDIGKIVIMVAGSLVRRGMFLPGLWRSLNGPMVIESGGARLEPMAKDGAAPARSAGD